MRHKTNGVVSCVVNVWRDRHLTCTLSFVRVRLNIAKEEPKLLLPILSVRIVALDIRHVLRMRHVILLLPIIFLHIVIYSSRFCKKIYSYIQIKYMFLVHLQFLSESFLVIRRIQRCYHCTKLVFTYSTGSSVIFDWKLDFLHKFRKIFKQLNPWKSVQWKPYSSINS